jgi:hypothetical protein
VPIVEENIGSCSALHINASASVILRAELADPLLSAAIRPTIPPARGMLMGVALLLAVAALAVVLVVAAAVTNRRQR